MAAHRSLIVFISLPLMMLRIASAMPEPAHPSGILGIKTSEPIHENRRATVKSDKKDLIMRWRALESQTFDFLREGLAATDKNGEATAVTDLRKFLDLSDEERSKRHVWTYSWLLRQALSLPLPKERIAEFLLKWGDIYESQGNQEKAEAWGLKWARDISESDARKSFNEALTFFQEAEKIIASTFPPEDQRALCSYKVCRLLFGTEKYADSISAGTKALSVISGATNANALRATIHDMMGQSYYKIGKFPESSRQCDTALNYYRMVEGSTQEQIACLRKMADSLNRIGKHCEMIEKYEKAQEYFHSIPRNASLEAFCYWGIGIQYEYMANYVLSARAKVQAIPLYALAKQPKESRMTCLRNLALTYHVQGKPLEFMLVAALLGKDQSQLLGWAYEACGELKEASRCYREAADNTLGLSSSEVHAANLFFLSRTHFKLGKQFDGLCWLEEATNEVADANTIIRKRQCPRFTALVMCAFMEKANQDLHNHTGAKGLESTRVVGLLQWDSDWEEDLYHMIEFIESMSRSTEPSGFQLTSEAARVAMNTESLGVEQVALFQEYCNVIGYVSDAVPGFWRIFLLKFASSLALELDRAEAINLLDQALEIVRGWESNTERWLVERDLLYQVSMCEAKIGSATNALSALESACALGKRVASGNDVAGKAQDLVREGDICFTLGAYERALETFNNAKDLLCNSITNEESSRRSIYNERAKKAVTEARRENGLIIVPLAMMDRRDFRSPSPFLLPSVSLRIALTLGRMGRYEDATRAFEEIRKPHPSIVSFGQEINADDLFSQTVEEAQFWNDVSISRISNPLDAERVRSGEMTLEEALLKTKMRQAGKLAAFAHKRLSHVMDTLPLLSEEEALHLLTAPTGFDLDRYYSFVFSIISDSTGSARDVVRGRFDKSSLIGDTLDVALSYKNVLTEVNLMVRKRLRSGQTITSKREELRSLRAEMSRQLFKEDITPRYSFRSSHGDDLRNDEAHSVTEPVALVRKVKELQRREAFKTMREDSGDGARAPSFNDLSSALPDEAMHLEFIRYKRVDVATGKPLEDQYAVFTVGRFFELGALCLGPAYIIDEAIQSFRNEVNRTGKETHYPSLGDEVRVRKLAAEVYRLVFEPLVSRKLIDRETRLFIAPDGEISSIPFEALPSPRDPSGKRFMVEDFEIIYLSTGRDLIHMYKSLRDEAERVRVGETKMPHDLGRALIVGDPVPNLTEYERAVIVAQRGSNETQREGAQLSALDVTARYAQGIQLLNIQYPRGGWRELVGASDFLSVLGRDLNESAGLETHLLLKRDALEELLAKESTPKIVQILTHGFFLPIEEKGGEEIRDFSGPFTQMPWFRLREKLLRENPMIRSMLVFSGANNRKESIFHYHDGRVLDVTEGLSLLPDVRVKTEFRICDGLLTAQEVADMDFSSTDLVVLTACQSGVGVPQQGRGISGFRQAFRLAGAKAIISSLWDVPLKESLVQLRSFYRNWLGGNPRYQSFRESQLTALRAAKEEHGTAHPFLWAGFVYSGEPVSFSELTGTSFSQK